MNPKFFTPAFAIVLFTSSGILYSCQDSAIPLPFAIPLSLETTIPFASVTTTGYFTYPEVKMDIDVDAKIKEKYSALSVNNLKSVKLESFNIILKSSKAGGKLDAVKNALVYIKTPNLERKLIATVQNNTQANQITFTTESTEIIEYLKSKKNSLILEIQGQKLSADELTILINPSFRISVGI